MSTITKESIADTIEGLEHLANSGFQSVYIDMAIAGMRRLLASLEARPVAYIGKIMLEDLTDGARSCGRVWPDATDKMSGEDRIALYIAPPAPVSVPECFKRLLHHAYGMTMGHDWNKGTMAGHHRTKLCQVVEECRAAMLQGTDGNSPVIPDGYCIMPLKLTADNGAKGALCGEFHVQYRIVCQSCVGEGCEDCNHTGGWNAEIPVSWDTIKRIHESAVEACALPAAPQQE